MRPKGLLSPALMGVWQPLGHPGPDKTLILKVCVREISIICYVRALLGDFLLKYEDYVKTYVPLGLERFRPWPRVDPRPIVPFRAMNTSALLFLSAGFYPVNHTDCLQSYLHHCFDGITGELAHAFFPPTGEIHFDDDEYWVLGNMRFSWEKGESFCLYINVSSGSLALS